MKRCPECGRDYNDDSLSFCLDDGSELLFGPRSLGGRSDDEPATAILSEPPASAAGHFDEPQTAILNETDSPSEAHTRAQIHTTAGQTALLPVEKHEPNKRWLLFPLALLVIAAAGFLGYRYFAPGSGPVHSVAVLPFENSSGDPDSEYLSDGLAESLIYRLSQLPDLRVSPRSSVFRYKGKAIDVENIGTELGVDAVLSGRITQRGDNLTISVDLVDVRNKKTLWGEQFERKMSDLLATQREIASTVTQKLQIKFTGDEPGAAKKYTNSNEAYQLYLKGRHAWNRRTAESLKQALDFYKRAIAEDPAFALAYSGLAETYVLFASYDVAPAKEALPQAKDAAMRALELDESLAEAHVAYASYLSSYEYDTARAEAEYRRAIQLNPGYATAYQWLGELLAHLHRLDEGMAMTRKAQELDPLSPVISFNIGWQYFAARRYDEAIAEYDTTLAKFPDFHLTHTGKCWAFYAKGDLVKAVPECRKAHELVSDAPTTGYLAMVLGASGNTDEAKRLLDQLKKESERRPVPKTAFAYAYIGLNQKEEALHMLELDVEEHGYLTLDFGINPEYDQFRSDPRFKALLRRMNMLE